MIRWKVFRLCRLMFRLCRFMFRPRRLMFRLCRLMSRLCRFADLCSDFADSCSDFAGLCSDFPDLCLDFADFELPGDYEFLVPTRIDSDLLSLNIKPRPRPGRWKVSKVRAFWTLIFFWFTEIRRTFWRPTRDEIYLKFLKSSWKRPPLRDKALLAVLTSKNWVRQTCICSRTNVVAHFFLQNYWSARPLAQENNKNICVAQKDNGN